MRMVLAKVIGVRLPWYCLLLALSSICSSTHADEPTRKEKLAVKKIHELIDKGGRLFKAKNYDASIAAIADAQKRMGKVSNGADAELLEILKPEHARLVLAHKLLTDAGQSPNAIEPLPAPAVTSDGLVSFKNQVAPLLSAKCGKCHVDRNRGDFSAASFNAIGQSTMVAVGLPNDSRIIEVIVDGDMPPGGSLLDKELQLLKDWISQGAKFDGDDADKNLREFGLVDSQSTNMRPTGNETVSFASHVAPILLENCATCHITDNPRANFSMQNFARIMRGGDSGSPIQAGNGSESLIVKRLRGLDGLNVMPPSGKLDDSQILIVENWINEGAKFDGEQARLATRTVAATAKAASQTHPQLVADRVRFAEKNWRLAMPDIEPATTTTDNFHLFGNISQTRLDQLGILAEQIVPKIESNLKLKTGGPFVKGNVAVFVFEKHYDFSEFATMIENHSLPKEVTGHWGFNTIDAYATLNLKIESDPDNTKVALARQLGAIKVSNLSSDMPRWFADGMGRWLAERIYPKDESIKTWDNQANHIVANMNQPGDFLAGKLPEHHAGLVSYLFVKRLRGDSSRFKKLFRSLSDNRPFEQAFLLAYGATPQSLFGTEPTRNGRGRRSR